jgi:hypothetical protein
METRTRLVLVAQVPVSDMGTRVQVRVRVPVSNEYYSFETSMSTTCLIRVLVICTHNRKLLAYIIKSILHTRTVGNCKRH